MIEQMVDYWLELGVDDVLVRKFLVGWNVIVSAGDKVIAHGVVSDAVMHDIEFEVSTLGLLK